MAASFPLFLVTALCLLNVCPGSTVNNEVYLQREHWIKAAQCILQCPGIEDKNCSSECVKAAWVGNLTKSEVATAEETCYFPGGVSIEDVYIGNTTTKTSIDFLPVVDNQSKSMRYRNILYMLLKNGQDQEQYSFLAADKKTKFVIEMQLTNFTIMAIGNEGLMCELRLDYKEDEDLVNYTENMKASVYQVIDFINLKMIKNPGAITHIHRGVAALNVYYILSSPHEPQNVKIIKIVFCLVCLAIQETTGMATMFSLLSLIPLGVINSCILLFAILMHHLYYYLYQ